MSLRWRCYSKGHKATSVEITLFSYIYSKIHHLDNALLLTYYTLRFLSSPSHNLPENPKTAFPLFNLKWHMHLNPLAASWSLTVLWNCHIYVVKLFLPSLVNLSFIELRAPATEPRRVKRTSFSSHTVFSMSMGQTKIILLLFTI